MPSDLERIRALAIQRTARWQQERERRNQEKDGSDADAISDCARNDLPKWIAAVEKAIRRGELELKAEISSKGLWNWWAVLDKRAWWPSRSAVIKLDRLAKCSSGFERYAEELGRLMGQPFRITFHDDSEYCKDYFLISWH